MEHSSGRGPCLLHLGNTFSMQLCKTSDFNGYRGALHASYFHLADCHNDKVELNVMDLGMHDVHAWRLILLAKRFIIYQTRHIFSLFCYVDVCVMKIGIKAHNFTQTLLESILYWCLKDFLLGFLVIMCFIFLCNDLSLPVKVCRSVQRNLLGEKWHELDMFFSTKCEFITSSVVCICAI